MKWIPALGATVLFAAFGCGLSGEEAVESDASLRENVSEVETPVDPPVNAPKTLAELQPVFSEVGDAGAAPRSLVLRFGREVIAPESVGTVADGLGASIQPVVAGEWKWTAPDRVEFVPKVGFLPAQSYQVQLGSVESKWGKIAGRPYVHEFETPDFKAVRAARAFFNRDHVEVDVIFSGPVDPAAAAAVTISAPGRKRLPAEVLTSGSPERLRFQIKRTSLPEGRLKLRIKVGKGASSLVNGSTAAPSANFSIEVDTSIKEIEVMASRLKESADGHYLEILCHDPAVGPAQWYWDRETYDSYELSERCVLSKEALGLITFTPAVSNMYIAEARRGFRIFGEFPYGPVHLQIESGAFSDEGGIFTKSWETDLTVPHRTPRAELTAKNGRYLPKGAWSNLPIQHLNTEEVSVEVRQVPPQNLVFWLSSEDEKATPQMSDLVVKKTVKVKNVVDRVQSSWIDVGALVGEDTQGLFEIRVNPVVKGEKKRSSEPRRDTGYQPESTDSDGQGDVSRLVLTDLQLVAKAGETPEGEPWPTMMTVWSIGAHDNRPVPGVMVDAVRPSGFVMATCRTSSDGSCELKLPPTTGVVDETPPVALVARKGDDLTYLKFADLKTPISEDRVAGTPWHGGSPYEASVYSDRGVYRPGDTVRFGLILRDEAHHAPNPAVPSVLIIRDPRRKVAKKVTLTPDASGMATWDFQTQAFATTGSWKAMLEIGGKIVDSYDFSVEEFVPERMKVEAKLSGEGALATDAMTVDVKARYLFGGSAEGSPVEVNCSIVPAPFKPRFNSQLHYGPVFIGSDASPTQVTASSTNTTLDDAGLASASCGGRDEGFPVSGQLVADVAVFEAGSGRATRATARVAVHPESFYIGLDSGTEKGKRGEKIAIKGLLVDWTGKAKAGRESVELVFYRLEEEYGWWWWEDRGEEAYELYLRRVEEGRTSVTPGADGSFVASYTPKGDGAGYLIRATSGRAHTDLRLEGDRRRYDWSSGDNQVDRTPRPAKPTSLVVDLPTQVKVGETAAATVTVPFKGRMLMTVETDELLASEWIEVDAGQTSWRFTVPSFVPNVYVSAFLVKDPHLDSPKGYTPERAFGVSSVRVSPEEFSLNVKLNTPGEVRSNSPLKVEVDLGKAGAKASLTVAAVDQGILQLTRFQTPDPIKDVFPNHALGISTYETVGWSILMPAGVSSSHGGDAGGAAGRVQPVKPVALWSGKVTADNHGKATITLDVPQYRGALRVMAVASTSERLGSAAAEVLVRDPLVLQTTLPRFLTEGDSFQIPVFVTNMSGKDREVSVSMSAENLPWPGMPADPNAPSPITFLGDRQGKVTLKNGESKTVAFHARATAQVGAATFRVKVESGNLVSYEELDVPFAPSGPRTRTTEQITLTNGKLDLSPYLEGWLPTTEKSNLWVTANPYGRAMGHLKHVVRYPHGCIEQTTSSTRPLLFVSSLVPAMMPSLQGPQLEKMVMHGIDRVLSMQTPSGGFGYWPGSRHPTSWGTTYATHMLLDAKKLQYDVPQDRIDDALDYLEELVRRNQGNTSGFQSYRYSEPYAHYVLAVAGRGKKARVSELIKRFGTPTTGEDHEALYLLKAALFHAGDRSYEAELRKPDVTKLTGNRVNSWTYYSDLRRRGFTLSIYQDLFGDTDPGAEELARLVARGLEGQSSRYYTTQELVWGITGLGKRVASGSKDFKNIDLLEGGKTLARIPGANKGASRAEPMWAVPRASERSLTLDVGDVGSGKLFLIVTSEGVKEDALVITGGKGLSLKREYLTAAGSPVDFGKLALGDVVYTRITVTNTGKEKVQNLALVDRFGAGFEIENPRLNQGGVASFVDSSKAWSADHMNLRDDRLELFGALDAKESREVIYAMRAVTAGQFTMPPVEIEAMYDPSLWARQPGAKVEIKGPWAGVLL